MSSNSSGFSSSNGISSSSSSRRSSSSSGSLRLSLCAILFLSFLFNFSGTAAVADENGLCQNDHPCDTNNQNTADNNNVTYKKLDEAQVTFISHLKFNSCLGFVSHDCWLCPYKNKTLPSASNVTLLFDTKFTQTFVIFNGSSNFSIFISAEDFNLENQAEYFYEIFENATSAMSKNEGVNGEEGRNDGERVNEVRDDGLLLLYVREKPRVKSIDAFRGLSLILMIFVNCGGGGYWYFQHSTWNGLTLADVVFPWFVFIMGMTSVVSTGAMLRKGKTKWLIIRSSAIRSLTLFAIGLVLSNQNCSYLSNLRIFGVLQRLSIVYFFVAVVEVVSQHRERVDVFVGRFRMMFRDVEDYWRGWIVVITCIALHTCLTFTLPVPGCPRGYLGPGGSHDGGRHEMCVGGSAGYIDRIIVGSSHMYQRSAIKRTYKSKQPFDPEGILGTLSALVLCCLGAQMGRVSTFYGGYRSKLVRWMTWAVLLGTLGLSLCSFRQNTGPIPLNKNLWSLSFTLTTASSAIFVFIGLYILIDRLALVSGAPFIYLGMNSLLVYAGSSLLNGSFPFKFYLAANATHSHLQPLLLHLWNVLLWSLIAYVLFFKKIFVAL
ncbi:hypothetical protein HELRODRAFT_191057 [Helobdella robusta]|uniref:Heparan-alpha-glucosaminide N-acetyltransferase catalytic domain-containing protein n=1 Tax=Helobdella robusta TaxID=6412 RepID=T1FSJ7_HELRO|nr:hypothetical protein HELRODRAFT_191057 [Helobdella robusta]ESO07093.1 hypothetical protein HELRODRAFT_191057 [Helobdella robusta]